MTSNPNKTLLDLPSENADSKSTTSLIRRLTALFAAIVVVFLAAEAFLRNFQPQIFPEHPQFMFSPDAVLGHVLTPNFDGKFERADFSVNVATNEQGFRGKTLRPATENTLRIACLGDSLTWGWGVEANETYCDLLRVRLIEEIGTVDIQTVNAGTPFYGTTDERLYFRNRRDILDADIIVVLFNEANDFEQSRWNSIDRYAFSNGTLVAKREYMEKTSPPWLRLLESLKHELHLVKLFSENTGHLLMRLGLMKALHRESKPDGTEALSEPAITAFEELCDDVQEVGSKLAFVFAPRKMHVLGGSVPSGPGPAALLSAARKKSDYFLDLTPILLAQPDTAALFGRYEGYWTAETHRLVAHVLAESIARSFTGPVVH